MLALAKRVALCASVFVLLITSQLQAGSHRTRNFIVTTASPNLAREVCEMAENYRRDLAIDWLGEELPPWGQPCPITVDEGPHLGAGGATSFMFEGRQPFGWRMSIQGSRQRLLDSVLPHEITHTIFATHFGRPLPRWADEGACTTVEHPDEKKKQQQFLMQFLTSSPPRSIPFNRMFRMKEYPHDIMPLYSQGHSVAQYLLHQGGKRKFVDYVGRGMDTGNWDRATEEFYGFRNLSELQLDWVKWVSQGSRAFDDPRSPAGSVQLASAASFSEPLTARGPFRTSSRSSLGQDDDMNEPLGIMPRPDQVAAGSWYARKRDEHRAVARQLSPAANEPWTPGSSRVASTQLLQSMTARPQPTQRPSQRVLEWNQQPSVAVGPGVQLRRSGPPPAGIYMDPRSTTWR